MDKFSFEEEKFANNFKHALKIMRIIIFLQFFCILFSQAATSYSQSVEFTLNLKSASIKEICEEIEKKSDFRFIFTGNAKTIINKRVDITVNSQNIEEVLDNILSDLELTYKILDNQIIIYQNEAKAIPKEIKEIASEQIVQQQVTVKGKVIEAETGEPLPGASVIVDKSTRGVTTDVDGTFEISVSPSDKLVFSFIGMETQTIDVKNKSYIEVEMISLARALDEVTVVAFGKQKKESVVSSISTIQPSELKVPSSNLTTALAGRIAGVISYQRSGEPGMDDADFFIRGVTTFGYKVDPLILIDNVEATTTDLSRLQTDDIASFSIMKDAASTALYGARGANGVILVNTKSGKQGAAKISVRYETSASMPTRDVELADPITYMKLHNEAVLTRNPLGILPYTQQKIDNTVAGTNPYVYPITDWKNELLNDYALNHRVNLNVMGGGTVARYYIAGSMTKDNGILKVDKRNNFNNNINLTRYTLRSNVNVDVFKTTELVVRLNGSFDDYTGPLNGGAEMYRKIMRTNPVFFPPYFPAEVSPYTQHIMFGNYEEGDYINPYADMVRGYTNYSRSNMLAQLELYQNLSFLTDGLTLRSLMNTSRSSYFDVARGYSPFYYAVGSFNRQTNEYGIIPLNENSGTEYLGYSEGPKQVSSVFYMETAMNYARTIKEKHDLSAMLVYVMRQSLSANAGSLQLSLPYRNMGLSGRATYSFDSRYHFELNFGYNGSERFHESQRFGFFPSAGMAWSISNEPFWKSYKKIVSTLKLRGTYGLVGNDAIGGSQDRFFFLSNIDMNAGGSVFGRDNGYSRSGVNVTRYANEDITWETSRKTNLAIELGLFDDLLIQAEYFNEYRTNILMTRSFVPTTMGLSAPIRANVGEASGRGVDVSVDYSKYFGTDLWLQGRGNFTYATNKYEVFEEPTYNEWWRSRIGYSIQQEWGYIAERLFVDEQEVVNSPQQNFGEYMAGDIKYRDVNKDGRITDADMVPIGYPTIPEIVYGFGLSSGFKNFDLSVFFQGAARESFRIGVQETAPFIDNDGNSSIISQNQLLKVYADNYWSEDHRNIYALWPRLSPTLNSNNAQRSTWFQHDGSFLRLKQLEIGYTFDKFAHITGLSSIRLYLNGTNLALWSKFKLWDVEMASNGLGYPIQKVYNIGMNVTF